MPASTGGDSQAMAQSTPAYVTTAVVGRLSFRVVKTAREAYKLLNVVWGE